VEDFHAKHSALLESDKGLNILEEHCSLKLQGQLNKSNHGIYSLKMLKGYYLTTKVKRSEISSIRWMNLGMTLNGKCLTLKISQQKNAQHHKTESEFSLSHILEDQVDEKYFLSQEKVKAPILISNYGVGLNFIEIIILKLTV